MSNIMAECKYVVSRLSGPAFLDVQHVVIRPQRDCICSRQATSLSKLDGPGADKEAVSQQLATVQQQVEQVRGENEELRTFFQEALQASV